MRQSNFSKNTYPFSRIAAFSLIEISIVLVIISLLVGGITVGTSLYNNYKLMTILSDAERFKTAIKSFKDQYQYYPGDFPRAAAVWGQTSAPACNAGSGTSSSTLVSTTCNGMGNGVIGQATMTPQERRERFFLWQHLNLAGYLAERYTGFAASGDDDSISPALNVPRLQYDRNLGYTLYYDATSFTDVGASRAYPVQGKLGHIFSWSTPNIGVATTALITAENAQKLDVKMDDGLPFSGKVFAHGRNGVVDACTTGTNYNISSTDTCGQYYRNFLEE